MGRQREAKKVVDKTKKQKPLDITMVYNGLCPPKLKPNLQKSLFFFTFSIIVSVSFLLMENVEKSLRTLL
jgi:hypothetical protein